MIPAEVVAIPGLLTAPAEDIAGRYPAEVEWLRARYAAGAILATACSGALLLAEAGLLDGQDATTHWGYCQAMAARYPAVRVHPNRPLVISGEGQRLVMAGDGTSWYDLTLYLIARLLGTEEAMHVARLHLLDWQHVGQQPFATLTCNRQVDDALIARCQGWIAQHYDQDAPVAAMARFSVLSSGASRGQPVCRPWNTCTRCVWRNPGIYWKPRTLPSRPWPTKWAMRMRASLGGCSVASWA